MSVTHIVLTGGPCAGKSTGLAIIKERLENLGYKVVIMSEMATEVINSGINPDKFGKEFQRIILNMQLNRDKVYSAYLNDNEKVVVLYDRGVLDGQAYCSRNTFEELMNDSNVKRFQLMNKYDGVFHLVTAADGAAEFYTKSNNTARMESVDEALVADRKTLDAWVGHPHLRVIGNGCTFKEKMNKLMKEIMSLLGEPQPMEIEVKYLIEMPNLVTLAKFNAVKTSIIQTYLKSKNGTERRIRQRGNNGDYSYYYTEKKSISGLVREEKERIITEKEYNDLMMEADTTKHQIRKDRYCFMYNGLYYELDIYPFWNNQAILEIEVAEVENAENIQIPDGITVIKDVTNDINYKNSHLAINHGNI
ncbi:MAG: AAA family ATPase [Lachnospiraceae bacterium]|nr:AAA family ATPase [Lachnospiraceae bacterium]